MDHVPPVKANKKVMFVKSCLKSMGSVVCTAPTGVTIANMSSKGKNTAVNKFNNDRYTLDPRHLYIDTCATYHACFVKEIISKVHGSDITFTDSYNDVTTVTTTRRCWGKVEVWLNEKGITNILSVPIHESAG